MSSDIELVQYDKFFLEKSYYWLNDPDIKYLTNTPNFTKKSQLKWFNSLKNKQDYKIWGLSYKKLAIGACGLKNISNNSAEYWGYIGEKTYHGLGLGSKMLSLMIEKAKENNITELTLNVIAQNKIAIKLYEKFDFKLIEKNNNLLLYKKIL